MGKRLLGASVMEVLSPNLPRRNLVICLLTVGEDGYPNVCLLSPFQVVAASRDTVLFAVYNGTRTQTNLSERKSATFVLFLPPAAYYIKGDVEPMRLHGTTGVTGNTVHKMTVTRATRDYYRRAPITSSASFEKGQVLSDYSRVYRGLVEAARNLA